MKRILILFSIIALLCWNHACSQPPLATSTEPRIAATIFPLCDIARNVVGDRMDVAQILPSGASPHTYEPTPQHIEHLHGVKVIFKIGHGLDDWTNIITEILPNARMIVVDKGIKLIYSGEGESYHEHDGANPHYWLSISNGMIIARNIEEEVAKLDPKNADYYKANLDAYLAKLDATKKEIAKELSSLPNKNIITFHDAWSYFAEEFDLNIVGTFEPSPGKQPTPLELAQLDQTVKKYDIKTMFSEPELSSASVEPFVHDMGLKLYVLDPLGGFEGRDSYIALLKYDAGIIAKALSQ